MLEKLTSQKKKFFSFYGEDALLMGIMERYKFVFGKTLKVSYVDVGAWRPIRGSNTYFLYSQGIFGTVVEPNPHFAKMWRMIRPKDTYLQCGCGSQTEAVFNLFHAGAASNSFDKDFIDGIIEGQKINIKESILVRMMSLDEIVDIHLRSYISPFILDLDIEGLDLQVIRSFSFEGNKRPVLLMIEDGGPGASFESREEIHGILESHQYRLISRTVMTAIFVDLHSELGVMC
jgi:hypothetical protein